MSNEIANLVTVKEDVPSSIKLIVKWNQVNLTLSILFSEIATYIFMDDRAYQGLIWNAVFYSFRFYAFQIIFQNP